MSTAQDQEVFYRNVYVDYEAREEAVVRASKGYGTVVEIVLEGNGVTETTIRLSEACALELGKALTDAANALMHP